MNKISTARIRTLMRRELQEYKNSLVWTPIAIAVVLTGLMLISALLANQLTVVGDAIMEHLVRESPATGMSINIQIGDDGESVQYKHRVEKLEGPADEQEWNFSREWTFKPPAQSAVSGPGQTPGGAQAGYGNHLNPVLNALHGLMLLVLFAVTFYYLLSSLFSDRKDRSILFWKSMPVSEWEEVLAKFGLALVVVPAIYIGISILTQLAHILLGMLVVTRMDKDPFALILGNLDLASLFFGQISGWLLTALWIAPAYAWALLASAGAQRSPFLLAVAPIIVLVIIEQLFIGTKFIGTAVGHHLPHTADDGGSSVAFYEYGPNWFSQDVLGLMLGLGFAVVALWAAVWLRRNRFEA